MAKDAKTGWDDPQAKRLRQLRRAEGFESSQTAFAVKIGWLQSELSMYERGSRRPPGRKILDLHKAIPGFDPLWLTEGRLEGLSHDLRTRLLAKEAEPPATAAEPAKRKQSRR
jgi:transcriptional regulator with XRE-family HTH domain